MFMKKKKAQDTDSQESTDQHQPHDKLVKTILSDVGAAKDVLSLYLPKEVLAVIDLNQLALQKDTFIDDENRAYAVDLLYKTRIQGKDAYIWMLIEHFRDADYWTPVRLFHYIGIIWTHLRKYSKSKNLPLIYPLVIFNGDRPYTYSLNLIDLIEPDEAKEIFRNLFTRPFNIIDLPSIEDGVLKKQLQGHVQGIALLMTLSTKSFLNRLKVSL
jgi:predicted transposase/invertase (TIGR01784 family)